MTYKYEDLVVIPKVVLDKCTNLYYLGRQKELREFLNDSSKPLLPIVEDAFDAGEVACALENSDSPKTNRLYNWVNDIPNNKQEFISRGLNYERFKNNI